MESFVSPGRNYSGFAGIKAWGYDVTPQLALQGDSTFEYSLYAHLASSGQAPRTGELSDEDPDDKMTKASWEDPTSGHSSWEGGIREAFHKQIKKMVCEILNTNKS